MYIYIYIYIHTQTHIMTNIIIDLGREQQRDGAPVRHEAFTPGLHNKIPALKIFARGWVAQESIFYTINAKIFQGLGPNRRESCNEEPDVHW